MADSRPTRGGVWRPIVRRRVALTALTMALWTTAIEARLIYLQVFQYEELEARATRQRRRTINDASAERGDIHDRNGRVLAYSVHVKSVYAVPNVVEDSPRTARQLCAALECSADDLGTLTDRLDQDRAFAWVKRQVTPDEVRRVEALNLEGVGFMEESQRFYPKRELAGQLLGFVGIDNGGLDGIEAAYDEEIRGEPGTILVQIDNRRRVFSRVDRPSTPGASIELTIDQNLQYIAERELRAGVAASRAKAGMAVVMDPHTGEILALANAPTFNPNEFASVPGDVRRNRAVTDLFEPGSTFKLVTASAALEEGVVDGTELIDASGGHIFVGKREITDLRDHGRLSFTDVIVRSSNIGAIKVGLRLGSDRMDRYVRRFGFGGRLSDDFPAENPGIVWPASRVDASTLASMSMGHNVGVTALQLVTAVSSVANGGTLMKPHVVRAVLRDDVRRPVPTEALRTTISPRTAAEVTRIMEEVVSRGTGRRAQIPQYGVAGKTGTANQLINNRYSQTEYFASFVGFVPSRQPRLAIVVVIDAPASGRPYSSSTHGGGVAAAPVFKRIAELSLQHLRVPPTVGRERPVLVMRPAAAAGSADAAARSVAEPSSTPAASRTSRPAVDPVEAVQVRRVAEGIMPDLRGLSAREVVRALTGMGLHARPEGRGIVLGHTPGPGTPVEPGGTVAIRLGRRYERTPSNVSSQALASSEVRPAAVGD